tara:strand:+ start:197 stop:448 length:252 start_codon:yes stop_codon:yes gene_type:complete
MTQKKEENKPSIVVETDIDQELNIHDIRNDIIKCERLIKRSEYKIKLYKRKLNIARYFGSDKKSLIEKGLELLNLKKNLETKV